MSPMASAEVGGTRGLLVLLDVCGNRLLVSQMTSARRPSDDRDRDASGPPGERAVAKFSRFGLFARTVFYLLLVYLVVQTIVDGGGGKQANAHGALTTVGSKPAGQAALMATAFGFFVFGATRVWGALRDDAPSVWRRLTTLLQGLFYLALSWVPLSYTLGHRSAGSEQQQQQTARGLLHLPAGRELMVAVGVIIILVSLNQIRTGVGQDYAYGMDVEQSPRWIQALVRAAGTIGIPARAVVFLPIGIFFIIAGIQGNAKQADGLDRELSSLADSAWGDALLALIALGLLVFAVYSGLEARYRTVTKGK